MTPDEIRAKAAEIDSPALHALVEGHLQAGRPDMAEMALSLSPEGLAWLDAWFRDAAQKAYAAGAVAAMAAMMDGSDDGSTLTPARGPGGPSGAA